MKKILFIVIILLLVIIAIVPIVGNRFMNSKVEESVSMLGSHGVKLLTLKTDEKYLETKKHFEFEVEDSSEFREYLERHTHREISKKRLSLLKGMIVGMDVTYSNIPLTKSIHFSLYPLQLSKVMSRELKREDSKLYEQVSAFLEKKGLLYYGEYNLLTSQFKTFMKDIHQHYLLENSSDINITLEGVTFEGDGDILSPKKSTTKVRTIHFEAKQKDIVAKFLLQNFKTENSFLSWSDYNSSTFMQKVAFVVSGTPNDANFSLEGLEATSSAVVESEKEVAIYSDTTINHLLILSKGVNVEARKLHSKIDVSNIALAPFRELNKLLINLKSAPDLQDKKIQEGLVTLLSQGFHLKIEEISFSDLLFKGKKDFGGLKVTMDVRVKKDDAVAKKIETSPLLLLADIDMDATLSLSKPLYNLFLRNFPMAQISRIYMQEKKDEILFHTSFHDTKLKVNGKEIN